MKKQLITAVCGLLACSMLFAACSKQKEKGTTTTQNTLAAMESTTEETTVLSTIGTTAGTTKAVSTTKKVTTTKKKSSGNKSGSSSKKPGTNTNKKPDINVPNIGGNTGNKDFKDTDFNTLSQLKKIARDNKNTAGMDMFKDGKVIYAPFSADGDTLYGTVYKDSIITYGGVYDEDEPSNTCNALYLSILEKVPSHNLSDLFGSAASAFKSTTYNGKTYYYATAIQDGMHGITVISFVGDYFCEAVFAGNMDPDEYGIEFFLDLSNFTSASV